MAQTASIAELRDSPLKAQMEQYLDPRTRPPLWLQFPPALEARYDLDRHRQPDARPRILVIATLIIGLFTVGDYALSPATLERSLFFRILVLVPCCTTILWLVSRPRLRAYRDPLYLLYSLIAALCCIAAFPGDDPVTSLYTQVTFVLLLWTIVAATRLKVPLTVLGLSILLLGEIALLLHSPWLTGAQCIISLAQFMAAAVLSGIARHRSEHIQRIAYLLRLREQMRGADLSDLNKTLTQLSTHDPLTGLANRRRFDQQLQALWSRALQDHAPLSLAMIDVDHFKHLNDTYGHAAGDQVLAALAETLRANIRSGTDLAARFGGEEFILLLPGLSGPEALQAAERLRLTVDNSAFPIDGAGHPLRYSISCGIASLRPHALDGAATPGDLIRIADDALYRAKRQGRNRVCV